VQLHASGTKRTGSGVKENILTSATSNGTSAPKTAHESKKPHYSKRGSSGKHKTSSHNNNTPGERKNDFVKFIPYSVGITLILISAYLIYRKIKK